MNTRGVSGLGIFSATPTLYRCRGQMYAWGFFRVGRARSPFYVCQHRKREFEYGFKSEIMQAFFSVASFPRQSSDVFFFFTTKPTRIKSCGVSASSLSSSPSTVTVVLTLLFVCLLLHFLLSLFTLACWRAQQNQPNQPRALVLA